MKLKKKNIQFIYNEKKIIYTDDLHKEIKYKLVENINEFKIINNTNTIIGKIEKKIKIEENIQYTIFQIITKNNSKIHNLSCNKIEDLKKNKNYTIKINKEIDYSKLNIKIKEQLITENDFILIKKEQNLNYLILCEIKYNEKYFENININQKIDYLVKEIDDNFFYKKSKEFNLKIIN